jgi:hypothetical protein
MVTSFGYFADHDDVTRAILCRQRTQRHQAQIIGDFAEKIPIYIQYIACIRRSLV